MHKDFEISLKNISKIEGHTHLNVVIRSGKVHSTRLKISENKRFYTNAVLGVSYQAAPSKVSRICGTCSPAHLSCAAEALERAIGVKITPQTRILRELLLMGNIIRDHAMHLYFFCLPDILGKDSILDLDESYNELIHKALHIKEAGNNLCTLVGGRAVHPTFENVGYFLKIPEEAEIKKLIIELKLIRNNTMEFMPLFASKDLSFKRKTNFIALCGKNYSFTTGAIKTSTGKSIKEQDYRKHLERVVLPYSNSTAFEFDFKDFMVGALARVNLNQKELHKNTRRDCAHYLKLFPSDNIFFNNLAQAIEITHCVDLALDILTNYRFVNEKTPEIKVLKPNTAVGVIEAPRGTLYYLMGVDALGNINNSEIIIPTAQNVINMERAIADFINQEIAKGSNKAEITQKVERLIRAYDPCMSCATHFLKINWL